MTGLSGRNTSSGRAPKHDSIGAGHYRGNFFLPGAFDRRGNFNSPCAGLLRCSVDARAGTNMRFNEGGCLCSAIRFRVAGEPVFSSICHCATCRRASAAPAVAWLTFDRGQIELLSRRPRIYRSSEGVVRQFCGACGSQLFYETVTSPTTIDLTTASLDNPNLFPPTMEIWLEHRLSWQIADQTRAQYPGRSST